MQASSKKKEEQEESMVEVEDTDDYLLYLEDILKTVHKVEINLKTLVCFVMNKNFKAVLRIQIRLFFCTKNCHQTVKSWL